MTSEERDALVELDYRLRIILPEEYQDSYEELQPRPMRSAGLKFDANGSVAWNEIWASFCDLAMAGGPPHKGSLLDAGQPEEVATNIKQYAAVTAEICRGVKMVTGLDVHVSPTPGWVRITCHSTGMAAWLLRAIVMENISARAVGRALDLPAAPGFRLEKEIKNVVTVIAKTCHYWTGHMPAAQQQAIAHLFVTLEAESPLVQPASVDDRAPMELLEVVADSMADVILAEAGLRRAQPRHSGWLAIECTSARSAVWMMRALVVSNILSRREDTALFLPVNLLTDPGGARVVQTFLRLHRLAGNDLGSRF